MSAEPQKTGSPDNSPPPYSQPSQELSLPTTRDVAPPAYSPHDVQPPPAPQCGLQNHTNVQQVYAPGQAVFYQPIFSQQNGTSQVALTSPITSQPIAYQQQIIFQPAFVPQPVVQRSLFRKRPVTTVCPCCSQAITTGIKYDPGTLAWLMCLLLFLFGCGAGCCLIPFCMSGCHDIIHYCPHCRITIHVFKRM